MPQVLSPEKANSLDCAWYGRILSNHHTWNDTADGYQICINCKIVRFKPEAE